MQNTNLPALNELPNRYPLIYRSFHRSRRYSKHPIAHWGFECSGGWFAIIDELSQWLEEEAQRLKASGKRAPVVVQVKEKLGGLRFYVAHFPRSRFFEELFLRIDAAELKSFTVCEVCGQHGKLRRLGYLQTLCDHHSTERDSHRNEE